MNALEKEIERQRLWDQRRYIEAVNIHRPDLPYEEQLKLRAELALKLREIDRQLLALS